MMLHFLCFAAVLLLLVEMKCTHTGASYLVYTKTSYLDRCYRDKNKEDEMLLLLTVIISAYIYIFSKYFEYVRKGFRG